MAYVHRIQAELMKFDGRKATKNRDILGQQLTKIFLCTAVDRHRRWAQY